MADIKANVFDIYNNWLYAPPVQGSQKRPNMRIKVLGNMPRITVKTNVEGDKQFGKIDFKTDMDTFEAALDLLEQMARGNDTSSGYNIHYMDDFLNGKKLDKAIIQTTLQVGRDEDGRLYMALISGDKSRPRIKFHFGPSKYHNIVNRGDNSPIDPAKLSAAYAIGFVNRTLPAVRAIQHDTFDPNAKGVNQPQQQGGGGNGGGGYNNNRGNGGGNGGYNNNNNRQQAAASPAAESFDDFDF